MEDARLLEVANHVQVLKLQMFYISTPRRFLIAMYLEGERASP